MPHQVQVSPLVHVEVGINLLVGDERGQQGLIRLDQVARIDESPADPAADGGEHAREVQVETGDRANGYLKKV